MDAEDEDDDEEDSQEVMALPPRLSRVRLCHSLGYPACPACAWLDLTASHSLWASSRTVRGTASFLLQVCLVMALVLSTSPCPPATARAQNPLHVGRQPGFLSLQAEGEGDGGDGDTDEDDDDEDDGEGQVPLMLSLAYRCCLARPRLSCSSSCHFTGVFLH